MRLSSAVAETERALSSHRRLDACDEHGIDLMTVERPGRSSSQSRNQRLRIGSESEPVCDATSADDHCPAPRPRIITDSPKHDLQTLSSAPPARTPDGRRASKERTASIRESQAEKTSVPGQRMYQCSWGHYTLGRVGHGPPKTLAGSVTMQLAPSAYISDTSKA